MTAALSAPKTPFSSTTAAASPVKVHPDATSTETSLYASDGSTTLSTPTASGSAIPSGTPTALRSLLASVDSFIVASGASQQRVCDECYTYATSHRTVGRSDSFADDIIGPGLALSSGEATGSAVDAEPVAVAEGSALPPSVTFPLAVAADVESIPVVVEVNDRDDSVPEAPSMSESSSHGIDEAAIADEASASDEANDVSSVAIETSTKTHDVPVAVDATSAPDSGSDVVIDTVDVPAAAEALAPAAEPVIAIDNSVADVAGEAASATVDANLLAVDANTVADAVADVSPACAADTAPAVDADVSPAVEVTSVPDVVVADPADVAPAEEPAIAAIESDAVVAVLDVDDSHVADVQLNAVDASSADAAASAEEPAITTIESDVVAAVPEVDDSHIAHVQPNAVDTSSADAATLPSDAPASPPATASVVTTRPTLALLPADKWVPDTAARACQACSTAFVPLLNRKHHCRL